MRRILLLLTLIVLCDRDARAAGDDDWPCFLQQDGPRFVAALTHDLETSRQHVLDTLLGNLHLNKNAACPAFDLAIGLLQNDVTTLYDETISTPRILARLRPRWTKRWNAAQCAEVDALIKSAAPSTSAPAAAPPSHEGAADLLDRWAASPAVAAIRSSTSIAQRVRETLIEMRNEIDAMNRDANDTLRRKMPPLVKRDKAFAIAAIDGCITAETKRLQQAPAAATVPPPIAPSDVLSLEPPAPFVVKREQTGSIAYLTITSSTGKPVAVAEDGSLCQASFIENPYGDRHTQAEINERIVKPDSHEMVLGAVRATMDIEPPKPFDLDRLGLRGVELVGREKKPATGAPRKRVYFAMLETTKGYTFLRCATTDADFAAALPQLRSIRDAIRPPR